MRMLSLFLGVPAALAMMAVSMGCNWLFLSGLGRTPMVIALLSAASIAIDVTKALAPFWVAEALKARLYPRACGAGFALVICIVVSLASAVGFLGQTTGATINGQQGLNERLEYSKAHLADLQAQLPRVAKARDAKVLETLIANLKSDPMWSLTKSCSNDGQPSFCKRYGQLAVELRDSREAARIRKEIAELSQSTIGLREKGAGQDADPQAAMISRLTGASQSDSRFALELVVALVVEFIAAFGLFLAVEGSREHKPEKPKPEAPKPVAPAPVMPSPQQQPVVIVRQPVESQSQPPAPETVIRVNLPQAKSKASNKVAKPMSKRPSRVNAALVEKERSNNSGH